MSKHREQSLRNRSDILRKCYPLVATGSWDAIAISDIEKVIKQTRGGQAESTVHMLNWAIRSVKFLGVEFDQSEDEEVSVSDTTHL